MEDILKKLAEQLHVSAALLWGALVAQARVAAWSYFFLALMFAAAAAISAWFIREGFRIRPGGSRPRYGDPTYEDFSDKRALSQAYRGFGGAGFIVSIFFFQFLAYWALTAWLNPEYWALSKLLDLVRGQ